jgi:glycopeptide antibiotics resistance protein
MRQNRKETHEPFGEGTALGWQRAKRLILALSAAYTAMIAYWMFFGFGREPHAEYRYNLLPLRTIVGFLRGDGLTAWSTAVNICGNVGVFVPYGLLSAAYCGRESWKSLPLFLAGLLAAEILQLTTKMGVFDVDDILLNTAGFFIGRAIYSAMR